MREELLELPVEQLDKLARELPEIEPFIKEKRPDYMLERSGKFIPQSPHSMELSTTAIAIEKNLEKYRKSAAYIGSPHCIGDALYEQNAVANLAGLDEIDREKATDLLFHLKEEFAELKDINDWGELEDDKIAGELIAKLALKANRGSFTGRCPHCS